MSNLILSEDTCPTPLQCHYSLVLSLAAGHNWSSIMLDEEFDLQYLASSYVISGLKPPNKLMFEMYFCD